MNTMFEQLGLRPADILLPAEGVEMHTWAVIACDQFTSQPSYWDGIDDEIKAAPSTLRMIVPEADLSWPGQEYLQKGALRHMKEYLASGVLKTVAQSMVYVRRTTPYAPLREGLVAALDLEEYDYSPGSASMIRATEDTIASRLPPRIAIRQEAALECPHIMILLDDDDFSVIRPLADTVTPEDRLYKTDLLGGGGSIEGYRIHTEAQFASITGALAALKVRKPFLYAVGDGNHSLAAATACWKAVKPTLSAEEQQNHPLRYALVELVNIHDPGLIFHPIHRVVFTKNAEEFAAELMQKLGASPAQQGNVTLAYGEKRLTLALSEPAVIPLQEALDAVLASTGAEVDYIHEEERCLQLAAEGNLALLLPAMDKASLFPAVAAKGTLPRKAFSMGLAQEKRYYLECRKL